MRPNPILAGLLLGATVALAIVAGASLWGTLAYPAAHWRGGALAFLSCPLVALGARAYLEVR
jgi:hypothetical protein